MQAILQPLERRRFLVVGRVGLDLYPEPDGTKIERAERFHTDVGGSAGNIAVALSRLGMNSAILSALSDDAVGRYTLKALAGYGVDTTHCRTVGGEARTTLALAETRPSDCEVVIYRNGAADFEISPEAAADVDPRQFGAVVVTGTALAREPSRSAVLGVLAAARDHGTPSVLDLDYRAYSWSSPEEASGAYRAAAELSDLVVGNDEEFELMAAGARSPLDFARGLIGSGPRVVVFKMGATGAVTITESGELRTGIYRVEARKPFGAGDAFMGGMLAALAGGAGLEEAVCRGSAAAALVVSRRGCASAMPTATDLDEFSASHSMTHETAT